MIYLDPFRFVPGEPPSIPTNAEVEELARIIEGRTAHWFQGNRRPGPLPFDDEKLEKLLNQEKTRRGG